MTGFRVAYYFAAATGKLLAAIPGVASVQPIEPAGRWNLPTDVDVIFAPPDFGDIGEHNAPRPTGWPGSVKFVQIASSGTDGYPRWMFDGPVVATAAGTAAPPIAEYVLTAMLMHEKRLPAMFARPGDARVTQIDMMANPLGSLEGKTLGLLGVGHIGTQVARLAQVFGMTIIAHRRSDAAAPDPAMTLVSLDELLVRADHLVLAAPLTPETAGVIGTAALAKVKRGVHIVNIARGGLIDQTALVAALESGHVGGATLDVTDPEPLPPGDALWTAPNVRITDHISWSSAGTPRRIFALFADNLGRFGRGERLVNQLN
jgi:phosphoglycerate dehydrogenase-like enzyme